MSYNLACPITHNNPVEESVLFNFTHYSWGKYLNLDSMTNSVILHQDMAFQESNYNFWYSTDSCLGTNHKCTQIVWMETILMYTPFDATLKGCAKNVFDNLLAT